MVSPRKVIFVSVFSSACIHSRMRGALSYADKNPSIILQNLVLPPRHSEQWDEATALIEKMKAWQPDGILSFMGDEELSTLLVKLDHRYPVVSMAAVSPCPEVVMVVGSMPRLIEMAIQHFRQQGIRQIGMLILGDTLETQQHIARQFEKLVAPTEVKYDIHIEPVPSDSLPDWLNATDSIPPGLVAWLKGLPKPAGVLTLNYGGGNYLVRVCKVLGLRVPDDIAIICADDMDLCLTCTPTVTSVEAATEVIGFEALRTLKHMMDGKQPAESVIRIDAVDLNIRQSTGLKSADLCDIAGAIQYINRHACGGLTVERLIQETQRVSKMTFHKYFLAATGQSPGDAIRDRKIMEAKRLLTTSVLPITLISDHCGFASSSDFARAFKASVGQTPRDFRTNSSQSRPQV